MRIWRIYEERDYNGEMREGCGIDGGVDDGDSGNSMVLNVGGVEVISIPRVSPLTLSPFKAF